MRWSVTRRLDVQNMVPIVVDAFKTVFFSQLALRPLAKNQSFLKKVTNPDLFFIYFRFFQTNNTFFTSNQCEQCPNIHPVYGAGIRTRNLSNMSRHP